MAAKKDYRLDIHTSNKRNQIVRSLAIWSRQIRVARVRASAYFVEHEPVMSDARNA